MNYKSQEELFHSLKGAFDVKLRMIDKNFNHIKMIDIWNYLKITKWSKDIGLTVSEMVNDIIDVNVELVDNFIKNNAKN